MTRTQRFWDGVVLPLKAARFLLHSRGVKRLAILPLIVNTVLYVLLLGWLLYAVSHWDWSGMEWTFWGGVGPTLARIVNALLDLFKWLIVIPVLLLASYYTFTIMGLIVSFPFNAMLSERVEQIVAPRATAKRRSRKQQLAGLSLSFVDSLWLVLRQLVVALLLVPLLLIPIVGKLPLFAWGAYCMGLSLFDIPMGRNLLRGRHKKPMVRRMRWEVFGFGLVMLLLFMVPLAGLAILPVGVTAGTLLYCECDWEDALREAGVTTPEGFVAPGRADR